MSLKLITPPAPIVTWADLNISGSAGDQALGESIIAAVTQYLDGWKGVLGTALGSQTWELYLDRFPCGSIKLPLGPLIEVDFVDLDDTDGNPQTIDPANYDIDDKGSFGWVVPASSYSWPSTIDAVNTVRVRFQAGYSSVPAPIKAHIILKARRLFGMAQRDASLSRETVDGIGSRDYGGASDALKANTQTEEDLIHPYRVSLIG